jgi:hypothetical protein
MENKTKKCKHCQTDIPFNAKKCPNCQSDLRSWFSRHPILTGLGLIILFIIIIGANSGKKTEKSTLEQSQNPGSTTESAPTPAEKEAAAKAEAEWKASPAGQICQAHPTWSKDDCGKLANHKVWIGMTYDMLIYLRGEPDSTNVSNYGGGNQYQYCWLNRTPSCFYDNNSDGIMDSYN